MANGSNNQLGMVRTQFQTRGYEVDDITSDNRGRWTFTIVADPNQRPVAVSVEFIASDANPSSEVWVPSNIHWATDRTTYSGGAEQSAADMADTILATIAEDNQL